MSAIIGLALRLILAATLYSFLGWILYIFWKDLQNQGTQLASRKIPAVRLFTAEGQGSIERYFKQAEVTLGRDPDCDLHIDDDTVSARHARLAYHHGQWWLEDLGSTNGTMINRERLTTPVVIMSGDQFQCGDTPITIQVESSDNISGD